MTEIEDRRDYPANDVVSATSAAAEASGNIPPGIYGSTYLGRLSSVDFPWNRSVQARLEALS
jgi:hypothetical protein